MRKKTLVVLVGILAALLWMTPANAHFAIAYQGSDAGWVNNDHRIVTAADRECDGNQVYTEFVNITGDWKIADGNGCAAGDTSTRDLGSPVSSFRVCELNRYTWNATCSSWRNP
jgi:hypothetical protein